MRLCTIKYYDRQIIEKAKVHAQFLLAKQRSNQIFRICNNYLFSTTQMEARTRLIITLYIKDFLPFVY